MEKTTYTELKSKADDLQQQYQKLAHEATCIEQDMSRGEQRLANIRKLRADLIKRYNSIRDVLSDEGIQIGGIDPNIR